MSRRILISAILMAGVVNLIGLRLSQAQVALDEFDLFGHCRLERRWDVDVEVSTGICSDLGVARAGRGRSSERHGGDGIFLSERP